MQMQDTAKGMQARRTKLIERSHKQLPVLFPQRSATQTKSMQRKHELMELSNLIIYVVRPIAYLHETNEKHCMSGCPDVLHSLSDYPNVRHGPNIFQNCTPGDE